jgi:Rad3-related DNA helicase
VRRIIKELNPEGWVAERTDDAIKMSPLRPTPFMKEVVTKLNDRNIVMSATILDGKFLMKEYDLDPAETLFFTAPSPFPKENRPIYFVPTGRIVHDQMVNTMKPFAEMVKMLLNDAHPNERGIIFTSSYAQVKELMRQVNDRRLVTHEGSAGKPKMMERHRIVPNSVIVSPSMHEGVDLKEDLSRFQIVLKVPYPSLGSKVIAARNEVEPEWYNYITALSLIQSTGRSVRSETDKATTYILDEAFGRFSSRWSRFLPPYWTEALTDA